MIDIKQYIDRKTALHCETEQESIEINELIVKLGGKDLHCFYNVYENYTCYDLEFFDLKANCYCSLSYYQENEYNILKAKDVLNKKEIMKHTFKNGTTVEGSFSREQLKEIAKVFGESLYPVYKSATKGDIPVDEMNEIHLRNAILLHLREYFTQTNFKDVDNESFLDNLDIQNFPETIKMLYNELNRRINERN